MTAVAIDSLVTVGTIAERELAVSVRDLEVR
jgi:hypothetical protein